MRVYVKADVASYVNSMRKVQHALDKQHRRARRRELIANTLGIIGATIVVGYVLFSAWMIASGTW